MSAADRSVDVDAVVVGAGFAGLGLLRRLRDSGFSAVLFEAGDGVGGTWYWNRYPGANCDSDCEVYSFSFSPELLRDWRWKRRYPSQPEVLEYLNHVADRFDLRRDIRLNTRVASAVQDPQNNRWEIATEDGDVVRARFFITAVGCLSSAQVPEFAGLEAFQG